MGLGRESHVCSRTTSKHCRTARRRSASSWHRARRIRARRRRNANRPRRNRCSSGGNCSGRAWRLRQHARAADAHGSTRRRDAGARRLYKRHGSASQFWGDAFDAAGTDAGCAVDPAASRDARLYALTAGYRVRLNTRPQCRMLHAWQTLDGWRYSYKPRGNSHGSGT
jgi:hypothetical protein